MSLFSESGPLSGMKGGRDVGWEAKDLWIALSSDELGRI